MVAQTGPRRGGCQGAGRHVEKWQEDGDGRRYEEMGNRKQIVVVHDMHKKKWLADGVVR